MTGETARLLRAMFDAATGAAAPARCVPPNLPDPPAGRTVVVGAGKAAAEMARAVERHWTQPLSGLVVTRYGHGAQTDRIEVVEAGHPLPDDAGQTAARRILDLCWRFDRRRSHAVPDLGRRIGVAVAAGRGAFPRRQAEGQRRPAPVRRDDFGDQLRAQASVGDQGRPARAGRRAGAGRDIDHLGRPRRRPGDGGVRTHRRRPDDTGPGAGGSGEVRDRCAAGRRCGTWPIRRMRRPRPSPTPISASSPAPPTPWPWRPRPRAPPASNRSSSATIWRARRASWRGPMPRSRWKRPVRRR